MKSPPFFFALLLLVFGTGPLAAATKPNFVIFIADDHSQLDAQPYGSTDIRTPNMARLAREGTTFTHAFVASPSCGPSRTALLTGLWPARNGAEPNHKSKRPEVASLPPVLHALGYEVAAFGKVAHGASAKDHGFDLVVGDRIGITDTTEVARFLATRDGSKPLCLFVGTRHPHVPWSENEGYDPATLKLPPTYVDTPETRAMRAKYNTDVTKADKLLGEVYDLARERVRGETLFIYTSDHGSQWPFGKWNLYDAGIRVPFLAVWPGMLKPATTSAAMLCWPDILPTLIELGGGTTPEGVDGKSFARVLRGESTAHRDRVYSTHSGDGNFNVYPIRSVRSPGWKYIRNLHPEFQHHSHISRAAGRDGLAYWNSWLTAAASDPVAAAKVKHHIERPAEELYDLGSDPFEQRNLAADLAHAERLASMRAELEVWMQAQGDQKTVFGEPLRIGEPVMLLQQGPAPGKKNPPTTPKP